MKHPHMLTGDAMASDAAAKSARLPVDMALRD